MSNPPSKERLYELYWRDHHSLTEISELFAVGRGTVRRWFREYGIQTAPNAHHNGYVFAQIPRERLYELYWGEGLLLREIGERYNVSRRSVRRMIMKHHIPDDPQRTPQFSGESIPPKYQWPDDRDNGVNPQDQPLPENPDPTKYLETDRIDYDKERLYELYWGLGLSVEHIAAREDLGDDTIRRALRRFGIPERQWSNHATWEPHHGIPPKYEWPPEKEWDEEEQAANDYKGAQWRSPDPDAAVGANAIETPAKRSGD